MSLEENSHINIGTQFNSLVLPAWFSLKSDTE